MKRFKIYIICALIGIMALFGVFITPMYAEISFDNLDINDNNQILYSINHEIPGTFSYNTLVTSSLSDGAVVNSKILTVFPEKMEYFASSGILQIRNRYGTVWYDTLKNTFEWKKTTQSIPLNSLRLAPMSVSPDGKYACYVNKKGYANGELILEQISTGKKKILDNNAVFSYETVPAKWCEDSSVIVYEKKGRLFFANPEAYIKGVEAAEKYRKIGEGTINSVNWAGGRYLIYVDNDLIYKINNKELYTMGLYSGIIGKGSAIGRLTSSFNPGKDVFTISDDLSSFIMIQNGKIFTFGLIDKPTCDYLNIIYSRPYVDLKASLLESGVIWNINEAPSVWVRQLPYSGSGIDFVVYSLNDKLVKLLSVPEASAPILSPDKKRCAFYDGESVKVYDTVYWKQTAILTGEKVVSLLWQNNSTIFVGGQKTVRKWNVTTGIVETLLLSSVKNAGWSETNELLATGGDSRDYIYDAKKSSWTPNGPETVKHNTGRNDRYRIYCAETPNVDFKNALLVRNLVGKPVTKPVHLESFVKSDGKKKVALVFDAYDNGDGLSQIIYHMNQYGIKGTFFLNGEFIRRYPNETIQISNTQNESGSMFFTTADLCSEQFIVDEDYIRRGLARNEDEFYQCTKKELGVMWHAPHYSVTEAIKSAGAKAGYTYVDSSQTVTDTVTMEQDVRGQAVYNSSSELIDMYMKNLRKNGGGVVPVTIGIGRGTRESYVYDDLDLLISAILDSGYDIVPVRSMVSQPE